MYSKTFFAAGIYMALLGAPTRIQAIDLEAYCIKNARQTAQVFMDSFPGKEYLLERDFAMVAQFEKDRILLEKYGRNGQAILEKCFEDFVNGYHFKPTSIDSIKYLIFHGEKLLATGSYFNDTTYLYANLGDRLLSMASDSITKALKSNVLRLDDLEVMYLVKRLEENKYIINIPSSDIDKAWLNLKKGNFGYLWKRLTGRYFWPFVTFLGVCSLFLFRLGRWLWFKRKKKLMK